MKSEVLQYTAKTGWSVKKFPALDSEQTLIIIFASPRYAHDPKPIEELAKHYPNSKIIGCSTAGEILGPHILDDSISVAICRFDNTPIKIVKTEIKKSQHSLNAGKEIAKKLYEKNLKGIFVLSEGLKINGTDLVEGLNSIGEKKVVITGGLAGDGKKFKETWEIFNGKIYKNNIVAVGFYNDHINIGHASRGGWDIFGPDRRITRSKDNILYELDDRPALELYKEYLGDQAAELPATGLLYPLAIRKNPDDTKQLVRTILAIDEKNQSLTFAGEMPSGYLAKLMRANFDRLITSASKAGELAIKRMHTKNFDEKNSVLAIAISCVGRRLLLGERTEEETESLLEVLPKGAKQLGFYSYGEISPYTTGECDLHNQTMTLTTIYEN